MKKISLPTFIVLYLFSTNCLTNVEDNTGEVPVELISFTQDIKPIMENRCDSCHGLGQNGFNSSTYAAIIAGESPTNRYNGPFVIPENGDGSPLIDKLEPNPQFGTRMPQGSSLNGNDIEKIRAWINEGALNN